MSCILLYLSNCGVGPGCFSLDPLLEMYYSFTSTVWWFTPLNAHTNTHTTETLHNVLKPLQMPGHMDLLPFLHIDWLYWSVLKQPFCCWVLEKLIHSCHSCLYGVVCYPMRFRTSYVYHLLHLSASFWSISKSPADITGSEQLTTSFLLACDNFFTHRMLLNLLLLGCLCVCVRSVMVYFFALQEGGDSESM